MEQKEEIEQFKRELKSLDYFGKKINQLEDELIKLNRLMREPKAINYKQQLGGNGLNYLDLMSKEDKLKDDLKAYSNRKEDVNNKLNLLEEEDRSLLVAIYVKRKSYERMAMARYTSVRQLQRDINNIIKNLLKLSMMDNKKGIL